MFLDFRTIKHNVMHITKNLSIISMSI